jgi:hypothetical protein
MGPRPGPRGSDYRYGVCAFSTPLLSDVLLLCMCRVARAEEAMASRPDCVSYCVTLHTVSHSICVGEIQFAKFVRIYK